MTAPVPAAEEPLSDAPAAPVPALPDRADAPVSEVAERFLKAVIAQVPIELIEELHLFSPLRQGTVETGIAVLAVRVPEAVVPHEEPGLFDGAEALAEEGIAEASGEEASGAEASGAEASTAEASTAEAPGAEALTAEALTAEALTAEASAAEAPVTEAPAEDAPAEDVATVARPVRHTVYTARYRYIIKGPERGKWESSIKAEADAPLVTVETVVRGVQRRAGEESEIVRYSAAQIARALRLPLPA